MSSPHERTPTVLRNTLLFCVFVSFTFGNLVAASEVPLAVSPGRASGAATAAACPTFSWGAVEQADSYELVVYRFSDEEDGRAQRVLAQRLPGQARSWTPSLERCLDEADYAWSIRALRPEAGGSLDSSDWSEPSLFRVASATSEPDLETAVAVVQRYLEAKDAEPREGTRTARSQTAPDRGTVRKSARSGVRGAPGATFSVEGLISAQGYAGDGSLLTDLDPGKLASGTAGIDIAGSAATLSTTLGVGKGGTGAVNAAAARTKLGAASQVDLAALSSDLADLATEVGGLEQCEAPFDVVERVFPEQNGKTQRICATGRKIQTVKTVYFQQMVADQVQALCDMWANMPKSSPAYFERGPIDVNTAPIKKALTDVEVLMENTLGSAFGAIDSLFNSFDNFVEDGVNPMFNTIDGEACPGDCWPTNPVNIGNLNLPNSWSNLDFAPFANVVDLAEVIVENPDSLSIMCNLPELREEYVEHTIETMPPVFAGIDQTFDYAVAETVCAGLGGHVCSAPEIFQLANGAPPSSLGCQQGDWLQGGGVIASANSPTRQVFDTPWPPISIDLSPLLSIPPGLPFSISYPILPTGGYRCCQSTVDF